MAMPCRPWMTSRPFRSVSGRRNTATGAFKLISSALENPGFPAAHSDRLRRPIRASGGMAMRLRTISGLIFTFVLNAALTQGQTVAVAPLTVIRAGTLIDGQSDTPRKNQLIFIRGERIEKITDGTTAIPPDEKFVDLSAYTVLPGLIDSHTHIFLW